MVDDDYILQDGEGFVIPLSMMDSRRMITDSRGNPAGQRPGFLYADSNQSILDAAHQAYKDDLSKRWMSDRWNQPKPVAQPVRPQADAASVDDAYQTYANDISNRWRR